MNEAMRMRVIGEVTRYRDLARAETGMEVQTHTGEPASDIVKYALLEGVSLLAMPTHRRDGASRLSSGSVTDAVLRRSRRPVLAARYHTPV